MLLYENTSKIIMMEAKRVVKIEKRISEMQSSNGGLFLVEEFIGIR